MPSKINASVSSGLVVDSDLTGSLQLQTGGNPAISIDSSQVTNFAKQFQIGGVLPPAFSVAKVNSNQGLTTNVYTKITFDTEYFDTNNNFASSTFTPTVAGYYQFNACLYFYSSTSNSRASIQLKKSGSVSYFGQYITGGTTSDFMLTASNIFYMNGTTDYMEVWGVVTSGGSSGVYYDSNGATTYFNGALIRAA